jgi:hypothetical protein
MCRRFVPAGLIRAFLRRQQAFADAAAGKAHSLANLASIWHILAALANPPDNESAMRRLQTNCIILLLVFGTPVVAQAADILDEVPSDALGFIIVHNVGEVDAKIRSLTMNLRNNAFAPLAFLNTTTGIQTGLQLGGDALVVVYPDTRGDKSHLQFAVWLPVANYASFVKSLGASSTEGVSAVTIAGEDLLTVRRGDWAVVADPDQRDRLSQLISMTASPPALLGNWKSWIASNDVALVAFESGIHQFMSWAESASDDGKPGAENQDGLFGAREQAARRRLLTSNPHGASIDIVKAAVAELHKWTSASPAIAQSIEHANMVGCGLHLDSENGNANLRAGVRVALDDTPDGTPVDQKNGLPSSMYKSGPFVVFAGARLPSSVFVPLASAYLERLAEELKTEEHTELDDSSLKQIKDAVELAAADVRCVSVLTQPGSQTQPVYTNNFALLQVASATEFMSHAGEVMQLWNKANRDTHGDTRFVFDLEDAKLGNRAAIQYSLDVIASTPAVAPAMPEVRQAMERLFGQGGKLRYWLVRVDDKNVLLAMGTAEQVAAMLKVIDEKQPLTWDRPEFAETNRLLPSESDWRVFFSPHDYFAWERRLLMGQTGVRVIGGPLGSAFPVSPPIGVAGGFRERELWMDAAVPAATLKSAYAYAAAKAMPRGQLRVQPAPRRVR